METPEKKHDQMSEVMREVEKPSMARSNVK